MRVKRWANLRLHHPHIGRLRGVLPLLATPRLRVRSAVLARPPLDRGGLFGSPEGMNANTHPGRLRLVPKDVPILSLADALDAVAVEARSNGLAERTVAGAYEAPARSVMRYLDGSRPLLSIATDEIRTMVRKCLAEGLSACTVRRNYLRVLRLAYIHAGVHRDENPVHAVIDSMRTALRVSRPPIDFFTLDEVHALLERVRTWVNPSGRRLRKRARDLAIFRVVAFRGLRAGELERLRIERDVDLRNATLHVTSKVVTIPRIVRLSPQLVRDVAVLTEGRGEGPLILGGLRTLNYLCELWKRRLNEPRLNLRNLRRSMATALDGKGAPIASIRAALGHVPGSPVTCRYIGEVRRRTEEALRLIEQHPAPPAPQSSPTPTPESLT